MTAIPSESAYDEYLNEQLINCFNLQTHVIQNLSQYSQQISLQLFEIKNNVETLANRVIALQQQQQQSQFLSSFQMLIQPPILPSIPVSFTQPPMHFFQPLNSLYPSNTHDLASKPIPFSFSMVQTESAPSRDAPFIFGPINSNGTTTSYDEVVEDTNDSYEPSISFKPIVHLSPVEVRTGEEDENILFCERAKLYRFDSSSNQMKERGIGEMKILQHKTTNQCRVLMRRDQVFKVCANHKIMPEMELKPYREKANAFLWSAIDFSDGEAKHEILCIKFKIDEQAQRFSAIFNQARQVIINKKHDLPSIENISLNDNDIITIGEVKPTAEQIERAKKLQLPSTFYLYESKQPCKGCRGCREDSSSILSNRNLAENTLNPYDSTTALIFENLSNIPSGFFPDSSLSSLISMLPTWFPTAPDSNAYLNKPPLIKDQRTIIKAKRCLPSNRIPPPSEPCVDHQNLSIDADESRIAQTYQKKTRNVSSDNHEPFSLDNYASKMVEIIIKQVKQELNNLKTEQHIVESFNDTTTTITRDDDSKPSNRSTDNSNSIQSINKKLVPISIDSIFGTTVSDKPLNNGFPFCNFDKTKIHSGDLAQSIPFPLITTNNSSTFIFGNTAKINFSDLAKQSLDSQVTNIDDDKPRVFRGQGSLLFSTDRIRTEKNIDEDEIDSYEPSISFKPIVHLSPVEVRTGEEDENILFCERAKLYRFDSSSNQMKERGIGEMKILQHKTTNQCRVLMRRDQVFKVCANHKIMPEMELKEHQSKENAYIWSAMDYSDGQSKHETLCVRFKTNDQTKRFFQQFNDAKQINANLQQ